METFERKETKYLLTPMQYIQFRALAEGHLVPAEYHESDVCSVYYDTPDDTLINRSLAGGKYKEKLRVRAYGETTDTTPVFVEIKKKFKGITYKRRVNCTLAAAKAFLGGMDYQRAIQRWPLADAAAQEACSSAQSLQIAGEIAWMRQHYEGLAPKMEVRTHRLSFVDADNPELRITFDSLVHWQEAGSEQSHPMFPSGERILEVKCADAYPMWLIAVLNECGALPQSVSKYGRAYQAAMGTVHEQTRAALQTRTAAERTRTAPHTVVPAWKPLPQTHVHTLVASMQEGVLAAVRLLSRKPSHASSR